MRTSWPLRGSDSDSCVDVQRDDVILCSMVDYLDIMVKTSIDIARRMNCENWNQNIRPGSGFKGGITNRTGSYLVLLVKRTLYFFIFRCSLLETLKRCQG